AEPRHRFAKQAATAANVQETQAFKRLGSTWVSPETGRNLVADIGKTDGVELVQWAEFPVRVPPFGCQCGETLDFAGVDGRSSGFGHSVISCRAPMKSGRGKRMSSAQG